MDSDPQLRRWYLDYNRRWFNGDLPEDTVRVMWEPCGGAVAETEPVGDEGELIIRINPCLRGVGSKPRHSNARFALIHEMVHVKLWGKAAHHGVKFQQEMLSLAQDGAFKNLW